VSAKLTKAMADRDVGLVFDAAGSTVGDYLDRWLSDAVKGTVRESTYSRDKYLVTNHIKPALGRLKLKNLNAMHLQGLYKLHISATCFRCSHSHEPKWAVATCYFSRRQ
jgi:integrase